MEKIDHRKALKPWYQPSARTVGQVDPPSANYLMIDGRGDPNSAPAYAAAVEALFTVSYTLKFTVKRGRLAIDYRVMPLEGLWWADDMARFSVETKEGWQWTMMIRQPEFITPEMVADAMAGVKAKKPMPAVGRLRFESFAEGRCAQIMHLGPFAAEGPTVERLHQYIDAQGGERIGKHHEIYLSDIRKADPRKWRTVIRQPFRGRELRA